MKLILIVLLGCNIFNILHDRVNTAIKFVDKLTLTKEKYTIDWILSGGSKNIINTENTCYEAEIMKHKLELNNFPNTENNYSIDIQSTNTAENFAYLDKFLQANSYYDSIYIVTSEYHHARAEKILSRIIPNNHFKWILGTELNPDSKYWELIHTNNIESDVKKAIQKYNVTKLEKPIEYKFEIEL